MSANEPVRLTQFARGAGCGCKIAPQALSEMLKGKISQDADKKLIVGNNQNDDAAVYDIGNNTGLISTVDFFMPIVDDAFTFGKIAAANSISDVYAMGGKPFMALAVLGWPIDKLPPALASEVLDGAREICNLAGITLAGGHTIDSPEPLFGLSVNGTVALEDLKRNGGAAEGDLLFLTKPLGSGVISTAAKRGVCEKAHFEECLEHLVKLNDLGAELGKIKGVSAMTDVTGFGLLGHLIEMAEASSLAAVIDYGALQKMNGVSEYLKKSIIPDATYRNWNAYEKQVEFGEEVDVMEAFSLLPDPQTNGGLLFAVRPDSSSQVVTLLESRGLSAFTRPIGRFVAAAGKRIKVQK